MGPSPNNLTRTSILKLKAPDPFTEPVELIIQGYGFEENPVGSGIPNRPYNTAFNIYPISVAPVPELSTTILTSAGLLGLVFVSRKYKGT
jgi:hypothetical protein